MKPDKHEPAPSKAPESKGYPKKLSVEVASPEAEQAVMDAAAAAAPKPFQEYPKVVHSKDGETQTVASEEELKKLGAGWK